VDLISEAVYLGRQVVWFGLVTLQVQQEVYAASDLRLSHLWTAHHVGGIGVSSLEARHIIAVERQSKKRL
jgi:hypothetical protein